MTNPELREQITATVERKSQPRMDIQELEARARHELYRLHQLLAVADAMLKDHP